MKAKEYTVREIGGETRKILATSMDKAAAAFLGVEKANRSMSLGRGGYTECKRGRRWVYVNA